MWCPTCQTDVATVTSADGAFRQCRNCHRPIEAVLPGEFDTRSARELLERWSQEELLDPSLADALENEPAESGASFHDADARSEEIAASRPAPKLRLDGAHEPMSGPSREHRGPTPPKGRRTAQAQAPRPARRNDAAHRHIPAPHFSMEAFVTSGGKSPGASESLWGQILAYVGVGLLTIGTTLVLWGYFGGPANYAPTGWLVTTAGQMLLFLGVVTLISGGMQQTTHEVAQRVTFLGEHMLRIEEATQQVLQGPHFTSARGAAELTKSPAQGDAGEHEEPQS
jgi:hypothetical protein